MEKRQKDVSLGIFSWLYKYLGQGKKRNYENMNHTYTIYTILT